MNPFRSKAGHGIAGGIALAILLAGIIILCGSLSRSSPKSAEVAAFTRQFTVSINGGQSLVASLDSAAQNQSDIAFKQTLTAIKIDVEAGFPLSRAMAKHPEFFDADYVSTVRQGEVSGALEKSLDALTQRGR